ncbi:hypothetical protein DSM100688_0314 [Bifidobacterium ramosum]|uniref:Uncharacterized protein n=1 Tax=Bifidobacterium ramosum TaxID=1798158 RepID=A0A6L4X347_9BIFI|nr:hypothetical protein [Bifidobacterium ramosum]KAB8289234.1 hypothetical protein DSM100688_0314 [Bifidobacterium ramosum]NEG70940.1 hypothetical protein [Bifidobacterium ramosum]
MADISPNYALHCRTIDGNGRHLSPEDVSYAWRNQLFHQNRPSTDPLQITALGCDPSGRMIEMVAYDAGAYQDRHGHPLRVLYHANQATTKFLHEFGLA